MPLQLERTEASSTQAQLDFDNLRAMAKLHKGQAFLYADEGERIAVVTPSTGEAFLYDDPLRDTTDEGVATQHNAILMDRAKEYRQQTGKAEPTVAVELTANADHLICG